MKLAPQMCISKSLDRKYFRRDTSNLIRKKLVYNYRSFDQVINEYYIRLRLETIEVE
jgi:hypothetical protein